MYPAPQGAPQSIIAGTDEPAVQRINPNQPFDENEFAEPVTMISSENGVSCLNFQPKPANVVHPFCGSFCT